MGENFPLQKIFEELETEVDVNSTFAPELPENEEEIHHEEWEAMEQEERRHHQELLMEEQNHQVNHVGNRFL